MLMIPNNLGCLSTAPRCPGILAAPDEADCQITVHLAHIGAQARIEQGCEPMLTAQCPRPEEARHCPPLPTAAAGARCSHHSGVMGQVALRVRGRGIGDCVSLAAALKHGRGAHAAANAHGDHAEACALATFAQLVQQRRRAARACARAQARQR